MIPILSCKEAFALDKITIDSGHLSEKKLMDNAGRYIAQFITEYILDPSNYLSEEELMDNAGRSIAQFIIENIKDSFNQTFIIIAGPGNNGGDATICHHYLQYYGVSSKLLLFSKIQKQSWIFKNYSISMDVRYARNMQGDELVQQINLNWASVFSNYWFLNTGLASDFKSFYNDRLYDYYQNSIESRIVKVPKSNQIYLSIGNPQINNFSFSLQSFYKITKFIH